MSAWTFEWDDAAIERLKRLKADGHSAVDIAKLLGVSKNAVIGKLYRLKTVAGPVQVARTKRSYQAKPQPSRKQKQGADRWFKMEPPPAPKPQQPNVPFTRSILELVHGQCKWPEGDRDFLFCGEPQATGHVYCAAHVERAYNKPRHGLSAHFIRTTQG